eukprot:jgi/Bigna1/74664/fgenesh1_pg.30_\
MTIVTASKWWRWWWSALFLQLLGEGGGGGGRGGNEQVPSQLEPVLSSYYRFAKPVVGSPQIVTGGRLTLRELFYLKEAGFRSIISMFNMSATTEWKGMHGEFHSSDEQVKIATDLGMHAVNFDLGGKDFPPPFSLEAVGAVSKAVESLPQPIYLHCHVGYTASLFAQIHMVTKGVRSPSMIYNDTRGLGWDYQSNTASNALISSSTGCRRPVSPPSMEQDLALGEDSYLSYYWVHRVLYGTHVAAAIFLVGDMDGFYNTGQILETHIDAIVAAGYKTVISFRDDGEPTTRLPSDPSPGPLRNFEFSDAEGNWVLAKEAQAIREAGLSFVSAPVSGVNSFTAKDFFTHETSIAAAEARGPVLAHCATGYRSIVYLLAYLGRKHGLCLSWAITEGMKAGFRLEERQEDSRAINFLKEMLNC